MPNIAPSLVALGLAASVHAFTKFETECTRPNDTVNFVSSSPTRGTLDILWSSLFTIIACTWTVLHLNVPEQRDDRDPGFRGDIKWALKGAWTKAKWMIWTVLAPELIISKNMGDLKSVKELQEPFEALAKQDGVPWSKTHSYFANMGGFVIRSFVPDRHPSLVDDQTHESNTEPFGQSGIELDNTIFGNNQANSALLGNGGSTSSGHEASGVPAVYYLTGWDLLELRKKNILDRLPYITKAEINDRSKTDSLLRSLAIIQISWTAIQVLTRAIRHLAIAQLEIAVLAFSVCAIIIYGLNWEKPQSVQVPLTILAYKGDVPQSVQLQLEETRTLITGDAFLSGFALFFILPFKEGEASSSSSPIPNHASMANSDNAAVLESIGLFLGGCLFSAIHIAAWSFSFPTPIEQTLWRVASIISCTVPLLSGTIMLMMVFNNNFIISILDITGVILMFISVAVYILARLFLIVEIFRTLFFLPPSAYVTTWATNIPHIS